MTRGSRKPIIYGVVLLLLLLSALASLQISGREGGLFHALRLSSIDDLKALRSGTPVRLRGVITCCDLESHRIYLQDSTGALMVHITLGRDNEEETGAAGPAPTSSFQHPVGDER